MKPPHVLLCCLLSAMAGALLCYGLMSTSSAPGASPVIGAVPSSADVEAQAAVPDEGAHDALGRGLQATGAASEMGQGALRSEGGPSGAFDPRTRAPAPASGTGPRPMSDANLRRVDDVIAEMRLRDSDMNDLYTLLDNEGRDADWSEAAEAQLAAFLRTHAGAYVGLEVKPPRCSVSVCEIAAVAQPGLDTQAAHADWQRLLGVMFAQTWFPATFTDPRMGMTTRDGSAVYVTQLVRVEARR
ncbi:hypothetical protein [Luteimonas sp. 3794]|uniref:hypothetical protein n=1 Tax=Luteimonas sp. 3794 TaxID=2817730 RepID=UPI00285D9CCC|nr:hypothetical protein [Luteimonas sp. 3794]MDR6992925.1 hypothetical protein [Luteimonas sp. 3794]